jgi:hypothetical protein
VRKILEKSETKGREVEINDTTTNSSESCW